jgi:C4-dicarboxylate-specific signal transduction histidine kinase
MSLQSRRGGARYLGLAAFAVALLLVIVGASASWLNVRRLRDSFDWVAHTRQVLIQVGNIEADLASAIATQRGYLLSGDPEQLAGFRRFSADLATQSEALRQLVTDNPEQRRSLDVLLPLIEKRLEFAEMSIGPAAAATLGVTPSMPREEEVRTRAAIRDGMRRFRDSEADLLAERQARADRDTTFSTWIASATVVLALGAAVVGVFFLRRERELLLLERERSRMLELRAELLHVGRLHTVGQTASMLTHEVNQPLTAARNFLGAAQRILAAEVVDRARLADAMRRCLAQVDRAAEVIRHLRRFISRSEGERSAEPVADVISEAIAVSALERSGSSVLQQIPADLPPALIDRVQIQQVLVNLMRNALEAMADSERKELTISARLVAADAIQFTVQDTGPGLPEEVAAKLFQPFVTTKSSGMGVGLSICRTIVEDHGGRIWAEPGASGGTAFHFTISTAAAADAPAVNPTEPRNDGRQSVRTVAEDARS